MPGIACALACPESEEVSPTDGFGLSATVRPAGCPVVENTTGPFDPPIRWRLKVALDAGPPPSVVRYPGPLSVKSGGLLDTGSNDSPITPKVPCTWTPVDSRTTEAMFWAVELTLNVLIPPVLAIVAASEASTVPPASYAVSLTMIWN